MGMKTQNSKVWLCLAYIVVLPLASPFGVGIHAGTIAPSKHSSNLFSPSRRSILMPPASAASNKSLVILQAKAANVDGHSEPLKKAVTITSTPRGEHQSGWIARILYTYVAPLLKVSAERQLESADIFPTPDSIKMDKQVQELERIYSQSKSKAKVNLEKMRSSSAQSKDVKVKKTLDERMSTSQSLILAKALFLHQKRKIILTGLLRLINTGVQAFPAILVARLLRLIEEGTSSPSSLAMKAAFDLVAVLTVKMMIENAYFHNIVKCSTLIRGSLSGMIFDKSLRVSANSGHHGDASVKSEKADGKKKKKKKKKASMAGSSSVLNLMQSDVSTIEMASLQIHTLWDGILQICIYSGLLYKYLGPSVFWGISVLLLTIPTNAICLRSLNRLSKLESEAKDLRTKKTAEAITNMKLLKLQAWETHFEKGIEVARKEELRRHINRGAFRALNQAISNAVPAIVLVVTLTAYRKTGRPIVASTIFTAISLFNQLRFPLLFYPLVIDALANGKNALTRISKYLCQESLTPYVQHLPKINGIEGGIQMTNGNFLWSKPSSALSENGSFNALPALCGADIDVKGGEIIAVVGSVGSGKSALIKALLGELEPVPRLVVDASMGNSLKTPAASSVNDMTSVTMRGEVGYCPQEAWLSKGTLKEAVLFGRKYDEDRYKMSIYDAGLDEDISSGSLSIDTEVGEGGSSLSGGQRARVQLARALYDENVGVYLLDDPLSALDAAVGATVFERLTKRLRQRNAAAVFVTNDVSLPRRCDKVVLMGKMDSKLAPTSCSRVVDVGTYDELLSRGHDLSSITYDPSTSDESEDSEASESEIEGNSAPPLDSRHASAAESIEGRNIQDSPKTIVSFSNATDENDIFEDSVESNSSQPKEEKKAVVTMDDKMSEGAVPLSTYMTYLTSVRSPLLISAALGCYLMSNGAQFFQQYVVAKWTELGSQTASALGGKYLQSLVHAAGVVSVFLWLRSFLLMRVGTRASEFLHNKMLTSVFNAPVSFFDTTPSGQLLSRFGKELETVDTGVPDGIGSVLFCFLNIAITVAGLTGLMTPGMVFPIIFISIFYNKVMTKFRPAARDLKRLETKSRSPIYTQFGEALKGAETIRSFPNSSRLWSSNLRSLVDTNLNVIYTVKALDRWLSIRLESLGNVVVLTAAFASVYLTRVGKMKAGSAGWGLTQSLAITGLLTWAVRVLTDLESQMLSVQRVTEVSGLGSTPGTPDKEKIPSIPQEMRGTGEALTALKGSTDFGSLPVTPVNEKALIASGWPWKGAISFKNVSMRYSPTAALALKNVNIEMPPGTTLVSECNLFMSINFYIVRVAKFEISLL
jgi:ABC-type multidrug transport system fused ATPase/permease subunit